MFMLQVGIGNSWAIKSFKANFVLGDSFYIFFCCVAATPAQASIIGFIISGE